MIKKIKPPTASQMKAFSKIFKKSQWATCCEYKKFRDLLLEDLQAANNLAIKILRGEYFDDSE